MFRKAVLKSVPVFFCCLLALLIALPASGYEQWGDLHWLDTDIPVPYKINASAGPAGSASAIRSSFATWQSVSGSYLSFSDQGSTSSEAVGSNDGQNICAFLNASWGWGSGAIAVCVAWYDSSDGHFVDTDIGFNARNFTWATDGSPANMDVQNIATHEIGHVCGLADLYGGGDAEKTMYGYASEGETKKRSLDSDDIAGVSSIYPSGGPEPGPTPTPVGPVLDSVSLSDQTSGSTEYTTSRNVNVTISASADPSEANLAEYPDLSGGSWVPYNSSLTRTLPEGDGLKTVYCRLRNSQDQESLTKSAGITLDTQPPTVDLSIDDVSPRSGDFIASQPAIKGVISESIGIKADSIAITCDGTPVSDGAAGGGKYDTYDEATGTVTYTFKSSLAEGTHTIALSASDLAGNTGSAQGADLVVSGTLALASVLNFPNPFSGGTDFSYQLATDADVIIDIYTTKGRLVKTLTAAAGTTGGKVGFNKISWNGAGQSGESLPNGVYFYLIRATDSHGSKVVKRSRLAILK